MSEKLPIVELRANQGFAKQASAMDLQSLAAPSLRLQMMDAPSAAFSWLAAQTALALAPGLFEKWPKGDGHPVLVIPGFLAGRHSTQVLRSFLRRQGYFVHDWHGGRNAGFRLGMVKKLGQRLNEIYTQHQRRVSIIGWSAGGLYARELARRHPELVRCVITLGSPIRGNPKASAVWWMYSLLNNRKAKHREWLQTVRRLGDQPLEVPSSCIYTRDDGIVSWQRCTSLPSSLTENIEVGGTHFGLGCNLEVLYVITDRLAQAEGTWGVFSSQAEACGAAQRKT